MLDVHTVREEGSSDCCWKVGFTVDGSSLFEFEQDPGKVANVQLMRLWLDRGCSEHGKVRQHRTDEADTMAGECSIIRVTLH